MKKGFLGKLMGLALGISLTVGGFAFASNKKVESAKAATINSTANFTGSKDSDGIWVGNGGITNKSYYIMKQNAYVINNVAFTDISAATAPNLSITCRTYGGASYNTMYARLYSDSECSTAISSQITFTAGSNTLTSVSHDISFTDNTYTGNVFLKIYSGSSSTSNGPAFSTFTFSYSNETASTPKVTIDSKFKDLQLAIGETKTFTASKVNASSAAVVWSTSNASVATINSSTGELEAVAGGKTTITAKITVDSVDYTDTTDVIVLYAQPEAINSSISDILNDTTADDYSKLYNVSGLIKGWGNNGTDSSAATSGRLILKSETTNDEILVYYSTATNNAIAWDAVNNKFTYSSKSNFTSLESTKYLTIGSRLNLKAVRVVYNTTVEIYAVILSSVKEELVSITATPIKTEYTQGNSVSKSDFTVVGTYAVRGEEAIDSNDCTVDPGVLNTYGNSIEVTVTYDGKSSSYFVKVNKLEIDISSIEISASDNEFVLMSTVGTYQIDYTVLPANQNEGYVWESDDENVATVSETGLVTYVGPGLATISVTGNKGVKSDFCEVTCRVGAYVSTSKTDSLDLTFTDIDVSTDSKKQTYQDWSNKTVADGSGVVYAGSSAGDKSSIQLRSKNSNSGIITTSSSSKAKKVTLAFNAGNTVGRTVNVYGKNTPYENVTDLFDDAKNGTLIGAISNNPVLSLRGSSVSGFELTITEDYQYIGLCSDDGAVYLDSISILWENRIDATTTELDNIQEFIDDYMYLNTYNSELGYCKDSEHHYYADAKEMFNGYLTAAERAFFLNDVNTQYSAAKARLIAWAAANGESITDGQILGRINLSNVLNENDSSMLVVIAVVALTTLAGASLFIRKRKEA